MSGDRSKSSKKSLQEMRHHILNVARAGGKLRTREEFEAGAGMFGSKGKALRMLMAERRRDKR